MNPYRIYALGQDRHWLEAVSKAADRDTQVETIVCQDAWADCLKYLPPADPEALLLIDPARQADLVTVVHKLCDSGWQRVVVVAADPSSREARIVLKDSGAFDYWPKSYVPDVIRRQLHQYLQEIGGQRDESVRTVGG